MEWYSKYEHEWGSQLQDDKYMYAKILWPRNYLKLYVKYNIQNILFERKYTKYNKTFFSIYVNLWNISNVLESIYMNQIKYLLY